MSDYIAPIPDETLKNRFAQFCLAWGIDSDQLGLDEYIAMIAMYYKDVELQLARPQGFINLPESLLRKKGV